MTQRGRTMAINPEEAITMFDIMSAHAAHTSYRQDLTAAEARMAMLPRRIKLTERVATRADAIRWSVVDGAASAIERARRTSVARAS